MPLVDLRADFLSKLDRGDCTSDMATSFLNEGCRGVEGVLRVWTMENEVVLNSDPLTAASITSIALPADYLELKDILVTSDGSLPGYSLGDEVSLDKMDYRDLQKTPAVSSPKYYARRGGVWMVRGTIPATCQVSVLYYGKIAALTTDGSENAVTLYKRDLALYAGLVAATTQFPEHDLQSTWVAKYQSLLADAMDQKLAEETNGGVWVVQAAYQCDD